MNDLQAREINASLKRIAASMEIIARHFRELGDNARTFTEAIDTFVQEKDMESPR